MNQISENKSGAIYFDVVRKHDIVRSLGDKQEFISESERKHHAIKKITSKTQVGNVSWKIKSQEQK